MARVFIARYESRCGICEDRVEEGQEAVFIDDEVCHASCAEQNDEPVERG